MGLLYHIRGGSWVPIEHNVAWAEVYFRANYQVAPSSI